jgi:hypothetical protein
VGTEGLVGWTVLFFLGLAVLILIGVPLYGAALIIRDWLSK